MPTISINDKIVITIYLLQYTFGHCYVFIVIAFYVTLYDVLI